MKRVTFRSGCLSALRCPLICSYVQGKFNTVELFTYRVWQQSSVFVSCCVHTCSLGVAITVGYSEECGRDPGVCVCVFCPKRPETGRTFCTCTWGHAGHVTYWQHVISQTLNIIYTHAASPSLSSNTHTHARVSCSDCRQTMQRWRLLYLWCQTSPPSSEML